MTKKLLPKSFLGSLIAVLQGYRVPVNNVVHAKFPENREKPIKIMQDMGIPTISYSEWLMGKGKPVTPQDAVDLLNGLLERDPQAVNSLVNARVKCNEELAKHPTVQVGIIRGTYIVGLIGVLNGLFGIRDDGFGEICCYLEEGKVTRFMITPKSRKGVGHEKPNQRS